MSVKFLTDFIKATGTDYPEGRAAAGYRIVIECDKLERKTAGGVQPYTNAEYERHVRGINTGVVVSVGEFAYKNESLGGAWCKVGDRVRFGTYSGDVYEEGGKFYRIINDEDIYEVIND